MDAAARRATRRSRLVMAVLIAIPLLVLVPAVVRHWLGISLLGATKRGDATEVRRLLAMGADTSIRSTSEIYTPLDALDDLQHGRRNPYRGYSLLMLAAIGGNEDIVRSLLDHRADVNANTYTNGIGQTALMLAVTYKRPKVVALLLAHGADVRAVDGMSRNAIDLTTESEIARMLQQAGAVRSTPVKGR